MKRIIKLFTLMVAVALLLTLSVKTSADTGPKPYIDITIEGDTKGMYMTLLSNRTHYGPWHVYDETNDSYKELNEIEKKFINYVDNENFNYLQYYQSIENNKFRWGYYPPTTFKILIYDEINDLFITDNKIYEKNEFGSIYTLKRDNGYINSFIKSNPEPIESPCIMPAEAFSVTSNNNIGHSILSFFIRFIICLAIEMLIALLFGFRGKEFIPILIVNFVTQVALNVILAIDIYNNGFNMLNILAHAYIPLEIGILVVEFLAYYFIFTKWKFKRENYINPLRILFYTLTANICSFVLGFGIISILQNFNILV